MKSIDKSIALYLNVEHISLRSIIFIFISPILKAERKVFNNIHLCI